jgi:hypothetical protein
MASIWVSLKRYFSAIGVAGGVLLAALGVVGTVLWLVSGVWPNYYAVHLAAWPSWVGPSMVLAALVLAPFIAFHRERTKHDALRELFTKSAPEIRGVSLFQQRSRHKMFDLRVAILTHDETAFRDEWELDVVLANGDRVAGMRGVIAEHALGVGTYALTVSFPFGARIPDLASLANTSLVRLVGVDARGRRAVYPINTPAIPLAPWQSDEPYPIEAQPNAPAVAVKELSLEEKEQVQKVRHAWRESGMYAANGVDSFLDQVLDSYQRANPVGGFLSPILAQLRIARKRVDTALANDSQTPLDDVRAILNGYMETYFTALSLIQRINDYGMPLGGDTHKRIADAWRQQDDKWKEALISLYHRPEHGDKLLTFRGTRTLELTPPEP